MLKDLLKLALAAASCCISAARLIHTIITTPEPPRIKRRGASDLMVTVVNYGLPISANVARAVDRLIQKQILLAQCCKPNPRGVFSLCFNGIDEDGFWWTEYPAIEKKNCEDECEWNRWQQVIFPNKTCRKPLEECETEITFCLNQMEHFTWQTETHSTESSLSPTVAPGVESPINNSDLV